MKLEYLRLTGVRVGTLDWSGITATAAELREQAKDALLSCYDLGERSFWPKAELAPSAAEEVRIVASDGAILASYSIKDVISETGRSLTKP